MAYFPQNNIFTGVLHLNRFEGDLFDLELEGSIPAELNGYFYRVQPDQQFPPMFDNDQFFNGDGMISRFQVKDGKVHFRQRWARTDKWELEREAGKALFGAYRNPLTDDESVKGRIRSTANTTPIVHAGKLFALKEDSPPLIMNADTMETEGFSDFGGKMKNQTFSAHPKICPDTGNMCNFGYAATGLLTTDCSYMEISPSGELLFETFFEVPYYCMMHDFALTENYAVFHIVPITSNWDRLKANKPHFGFDTSLPVYLGVLPRKPGAGGIRWFKAPKTVFASHVMNAYEEGSKIHFLIPEAEGNFFPFFPDIKDGSFDPEKAKPMLSRWVVDMASDNEDFESVTRISGHVGEFPRVDDRVVGKRNRYGWMLSMDPEQPWDGGGSRASGFISNTLVHYNLEDNTQNTFWSGPQSIFQEPCFVPRPGSTEEGDGYIVLLRDNVVSNYSELLFIDALRIEEGPVGLAKMPFRLRAGLHGNWCVADKVSGS